MPSQYTSQDLEVGRTLMTHPIAVNDQARNWAWAVLRWHDFKTGRIEEGERFARYIETEIFPASNFSRYHVYTELMNWRIRLYSVAGLKDRLGEYKKGELLRGIGNYIVAAAEHFRTTFMPKVGIKKSGSGLIYLDDVVNNKKS